MAGNMENPLNNFRYERKYVASKQQLFEIEKKLYKNNFKEIYSSRRINNIYYDDHKFNSFYENIDGQSERKKFRVRWYGNTHEKSKKTLEIKIKSESVNKKKSFKMGNLILPDPLFSSVKKLNSDVNKILIEEENKNHFIPILYNNYNRKYFYNDQLDVRITIDTDLNFTSLLNKRTRFENDIIIEIKYPSKNLFSMEELLNLQLGKSSKFITGIINTMNY